MAHIDLNPELPGIIGPMAFSPATGNPMRQLAEALLQTESPFLNKAERELIASYVSYLNSCVFCSESHGAAADAHMAKAGWARNVWNDSSLRSLNPKMQSLLKIAAKVQKDARQVSVEDVAAARATGVTDREIHDTVLIAAAFCMYNRYVDGLATMQPPREHPAYVEMGRMLASNGYLT
ncbi:MAG: peroxidase-related enzyme [Deltaproteobacteria bacterium]|nr:peroxidase-related enzyme [Deltaproteobacteria bacterium]